MRKLAIVLIFFAWPAFADGTGTLTDSDATGAWVSLQYGRGHVHFGAGGEVGATNVDFGSGTVTLQRQDANGEAVEVETYTALPDPDVVAMNFGGAATVVRLIITGSTGASLDWEIVEARTP